MARTSQRAHLDLSGDAVKSRLRIPSAASTTVWTATRSASGEVMFGRSHFDAIGVDYKVVHRVTDLDEDNPEVLVG